MRKTYHIELKSISSSHSIGDIQNDVVLMNKIIHPLFGQKLTTFSESIDNIERQFEQISVGRPVLESQRLLAPQKTSSCELKSATAPIGYILDDELTYQYLILTLLRVSLTDGAKILSAASKGLLFRDLDDVEKRVKTAQKVAKLSP